MFFVHTARTMENFEKEQQSLFKFGFVLQEIRGHGYRAVAVSKSSLLKGIFRVQMFFTNILPNTSVVLTYLKLM